MIATPIWPPYPSRPRFLISFRPRFLQCGPGVAWRGEGRRTQGGAGFLRSPWAPRSIHALMMIQAQVTSRIVPQRRPEVLACCVLVCCVLVRICDVRFAGNLYKLATSEVEPEVDREEETN
ncbi:hypothetical protein E2C01_022151 [Portunus trituberculatus]|uniref:Uncharacterized protein n=1 Tax=Portunus trituberculatus TaxID=210409 RepID=A0A5B7E6H9_PORTR|nr:hypothetical protein [Portunus trituberculatus]